MKTSYNPPEYPVGKSPLFMASCGCIGLHIGTSQYVMLKQCDEELGIHTHGILFCEDKTYTPLTEEQTYAVLENLGQLVSDGYKLRDIQRMMGCKSVPLPFNVEIWSRVDAEGRTKYNDRYVHVEKNTPERTEQ